MYASTAAVVLGLGKVHAAYIGHYDLTGSARFSWALAYVALLCASAYGVGLPELPRNPLQAIVSGAVASFGAAVGISLLQLVTGDALLPRFVVLCSAIAVVPAHAACSALSARHGRRADVERGPVHRGVPGRLRRAVVAQGRRAHPQAHAPARRGAVDIAVALPSLALLARVTPRRSATSLAGCHK